MSSFLRCYRVELHKLLRSPFSWLIFAVSLAAPMGLNGIVNMVVVR